MDATTMPGSCCPKIPYDAKVAQDSASTADGADDRINV
jgi:hypothetical protein